MRRILFILMLLGTESLSAQTLEDQMRDMRAELQRLKQELDEVKQELRDRNPSIEDVPLIQVDGAPVSSTRIRGLLAQGRVAEAARLLGRRYGLSGTVVQGDAIGRTLGYPTANLRLHEDKLVPADGIYAVWARIEGEEWRAGAMSVGVRPTFGGQVRTLEVHLLDWSGELVGLSLAVEFADWLRPELKFESRESLIAAMDRDVSEVRRRLALGNEASPR